KWIERCWRPRLWLVPDEPKVDAVCDQVLAGMRRVLWRHQRIIGSVLNDSVAVGVREEHACGNCGLNGLELSHYTVLAHFNRAPGIKRTIRVLPRHLDIDLLVAVEKCDGKDRSGA